MSDPAATAEMVRAGLDLAGVARRLMSRSTDTAGAPSKSCPSPGLPEFRPGDDLAAAIADGGTVAARRRRRSWSPARWCPSARAASSPRPPTREERDALRRKLIDSEAVRVLARKGRTLITENRHRPGPGRRRGRRVQRRHNRIGAAAGSIPTAAPRRCGPRCGSGSASRSPSSITDTMGRAWRNGQTDAAIGSAGLPVLLRLRGRGRRRTATSCWSPRSPSPTRSPPRPIWSRAS